MPRAPVRGRHTLATMGTVFSVELGDAVPESVLHEIWDRLRWVDQTFSPYHADSAISRLAAGRLRVEDCDPALGEVLDRCAEWQRRTGGRFSAMATGRLDPSGLVKGWAIEYADELLRAAGSTRHFICGGGDVRVTGGPWPVGIADPLRPGGILTAVALTDAALATSGVAERGDHVRNPLTGGAPRRLASVSVIAPDMTEADVWATALLADDVPAAESTAECPLPVLSVAHDGQRSRTDSWPLHGRDTADNP